MQICYLRNNFLKKLYLFPITIPVTVKATCCYRWLTLSAAWCNMISNVPFNNDYWIKVTGYCYHSVIFFTFDPAQSDHIKRLLLYIYFFQLAEPIRLLLHYTETEFEDKRFVCGDAPGNRFFCKSDDIKVFLHCGTFCIEVTESLKYKEIGQMTLLPVVTESK